MWLAVAAVLVLAGLAGKAGAKASSAEDYEGIAREAALAGVSADLPEKGCSRIAVLLLP